MDNSLLHAGELPYELPDFRSIREEHFLSAFEAAMVQDLQRVRVVAGNPEPATFTNTIETFERGGLALDEVVTVFHEFGHALHGLLSDVHLPSFSGTKVPRDFVEYPSQLHEMWVLHPDVAPHYARHHRTGEPLPERTLEALRESAAHGQGFRTVEYLAATYLDLAWPGAAGSGGIRRWAKPRRCPAGCRRGSA